MSGSAKRASFYADLDLLRGQFDALDPRKSGYIGYNELTKLVQSMHGFEESMVPELMTELDRDKDGKVSFEDFEARFALERETAKKEAKSKRPPPVTTELHLPPSQQLTTDMTRSLEYDTALDTLPSGGITSPTRAHDTGRQRAEVGTDAESPTVILRHKRRGRATVPMVDNLGLLSPIHSGSTPAGHGRPPPGEIADLATQMRYLTGSGDVPDSPQLNRNSRILSWISESEDMLFEDTGTATANMPSPPASPMRGSDEASHVKSILESVCQSEEIGREAINKLCRHVKADPQEEQELLSLLEHLDKHKQGRVTLDEFVQGLQAVRNAAVVTSTPPPHRVLKRRHTDQSIPILSEPFTTPIISKRAGIPLASTPLPPAATADDSAVLSVLDFDQSGYVTVDNLVTQWQEMGVENAADHSLQEALAEMVPLDPAGCVSVSELTTSLEGAILTEGKSQAALRQAALRSFKQEIVSLRTQVHHVSLERDKLRTDLSRTLEEKRKLVREGDEHVDLVTQITEDKIKEQKALHSERLREMERSRQKDAQLMQERVSDHISKMEETVSTLKAEDEKLRSDLRSAQEEVQQVTERLSLANQEIKKKERTIKMLQRNLGEHSELAFSDDIENQLSRVAELENEVSERTAQNQELLESTRLLQDRVDLLMAENEELRQKYMSQKRRLQRRHHQPEQHISKQKVSKRRHSFGDKPITPVKEDTEGEKSDTLPTRLDFDEPDHPASVPQAEELPTPAISPQELQFTDVQEVEVQYLGVDEGGSSTQESTLSSEELFTRSSASLLDEMQQEEHRTTLQRKIDELHQKNTTLEASCQQLEEELESSRMGRKGELALELEMKRRQQAELEKHLQNLQKQRKRLSATRNELDTQLAIADKSLAEQMEGVKQLFGDATELETMETKQIEQLKEELEKTKMKLGEQQTTHEKTVTRLAKEIKKLEDDNKAYADRSQELEQSEVNLRTELTSLQTELESERQRREEQVNTLVQKLQETQNLLSEVEVQKHREILEARQELETAQASLMHYQQEVENLTSQIQHSQEALDTKELELAEMQKRIEAAEVGKGRQADVDAEDVTRLNTSLEQMQEEYAQCRELNEHLQKQVEMFQATVGASKQEAEEEISKLRSQLITAHDEISEQSTLYEDEILQLKEDSERKLQSLREKAERRLAEVQEACQRQIQRYKVQTDIVQQELKSSEMQQRHLQEKLVEVEQEYENFLAEINQLRESEGSSQLLIADYQTKEEQYLAELAQCRVDMERYQAELNLLRGDTRNIQDELSSNSGTEEAQVWTAPIDEEIVTVDITDGLEATPDLEATSDFDVTADLETSRHSSSYYSEVSCREDIVDQMKSQLEELQKLLVLQGGRGGEDGVETELSLVQELLGNNSVLQSRIHKMQQKAESERSKHADSLQAKERTIKALRSKMEMEMRAAKTLVAAASSKLLSDLDTLHNRSNKSITSCDSRVETAASKLSDITATLRDREQRHTGALDGLISELDESRSAVDSYRYEVDLLKSRLDKSEEDLNLSHGEMAELQRSREAEMQNLRDQLRRVESFHDEREKRRDMDTPRKSPSSNGWSQTETDVRAMNDFSDGPQVEVQVHDKEDVDTDEIPPPPPPSAPPPDVLQKDEELQALHDKIQEKECQLREREKELQTRDAQIHELRQKLDSVVNEPIEAVIQYVDSAPLENVNDSMLLELQSEMEEERERGREREIQAEKEMTKLKEDLNTSLSDSAQQTEQLSALREALSSAEEREREEREALEVLKKEHQLEMRELQKKLSTVRGEMEGHTHELRGLYSFLAGSEKGDRRQLNHSGLVQETRKEIEKLKAQLSHEKSESLKLKETMSSKIADFDQQEQQFHAEHEEEVRALQQQKWQLQRQLEDLKGHYQQAVGQDQQNTILLQDLVNSKANLEHQLREKEEESYLTYQQLMDIMEEKKVLLDIIRQLCTEAGKELDIVV